MLSGTSEINAIIPLEPQASVPHPHPESGENTEKQSANLSQIEMLVGCDRKGRFVSCNREEQETWESWTMPSHRSFVGGPQGHQTTLKETWLLRVLLGHQATKKRNKISSSCKFAVGLPKKIFLQSFMKDLVCCDVRFTMICVFLPLGKHSFCFSFFKLLLAFITLTLGNTWDAFNVLRQPPFNTVPKHMLKNRATSTGPHYIYEFPA